MYQVGDRVTIFWQGKEVNGTIVDVPHAHCYMVRIWTGENVYRLEADIERRISNERN